MQRAGEAEESGIIEEAEEEMLYRVFDFAAAETGEVMIPRERIDALSVALDVRQALSAALESPYTRPSGVPRRPRPRRRDPAPQRPHDG